MLEHFKEIRAVPLDLTPFENVFFSFNKLKFFFVFYLFVEYKSTTRIS